MSLYEVLGPRAYRGHPQAAVFEAVIDPAAESRAIARGSIRLIERSTPSLQPGSYQLPAGWATTKKERHHA